MNTNEWRDLKTLQDIAAAQAAGDEIQRLETINPYLWMDWDGFSWSNLTTYRARQRQPKKRVVTIYGCLDTVTGQTFTVIKGTITSKNVVPYPKLDDEIEVES